MPQPDTITTQFAYQRSPDQDAPAQNPPHHPIVVVGAGPVGLTLAIDLAQRGQPVLLLDDADRIGEGSRAICFSKRALEVWDRLAAAAPMLAKGVTWQCGKIFSGDDELFRFDLLPEGGHKMPAFINLQQYYAEAFLVARAGELPNVDLRWKNRVTAVIQDDAGVHVTIDTPDGPYTILASHLVACDGARSPIRTMLGAEFVGESFEDLFLIADVKMDAPFPTERWFWFDPPFHHGRSALLHKQPDNVWRIDLQLDRDADPDLEREPGRVRARLTRMLGHGDFSFEWISLYRFQCRRMRRFVHDRVIFAGDAAHQVSPFGARGANSGVEDAENLAWKLDAIARGAAAAPLLASYDTERVAAADDNILNSTRATDFIAPTTDYERMLRTTTLRLAHHHDFAKRMVNGGRLSKPTAYTSPLSTPDADLWFNGPAPGGTLVDVPLRDPSGKPAFLTDAFRRTGCTFTLLRHGRGPDLPGAATIVIGSQDWHDTEGLFALRYDTRPGDAYLLRPDGYVACRLRAADPTHLRAALTRARGET
jgi:3-(3-hydroxy-phenyl)propionate hydroxylase